MTAPFPGLSVAPDESLSHYLKEIRKFPMLHPDLELELARRWTEHEDTEAAHKLVTSHLRLVAKLAMNYRGYGLALGELISDGNVGLMQAVKRFDPERGFRFSTYAMWWIRAAIQEYILHSWSLVKMGTTAAQKKLFFNLRKLKNRIQIVEDGELAPEHVAKFAKHLKVSEDEVISMNRRLLKPDHSLNTPVYEDGEREWLDDLVDECDDHETVLAECQELGDRRKLLARAMKALNARERNILTERRLKEKRTTLEGLSRMHSISRERVRQIEMRAFDKVQKSVRNAAIQQRLPA